MKNLSYLIIIILFMNTSCKTKQVENNKENTATTANTTDKENIDFIKLLAGSHSNVQERKLILIKNEKELNSILSTINSTRRPGLTIHEIDFNKNSIVGLFMGSKGSGGHAIKIDHILENTNNVTVYYIEKHPTGMATSVMTQPFYMAKIPKIDKIVRFELIKD